MVKINRDQLKEVLENADDVKNLNLLRKQLRRSFREVMPKRFGFLPKDPKIYRVSNTVCIEMPSWGSYSYRLSLLTLEKDLYKYFICDTQYYDGKTTFVVRKCRI